MFDATPLVETPRLLLRPFGEQHLSLRYVSWLNDAETTRFSEQRHRGHSVESCRAYYRGLVEQGHLFWAIERRGHEPAHIGNITAYIDSDNRLADVAILLGEPALRGNGFGFEAFSAACDWLLQSSLIRKVTAGTVSTNAPMLAIMRRLGMAVDGVRQRHYLIDGAEVDLVYGALFAGTSSSS